MECIREMPVCRNPISLRKEQAVFCMRQHRKPVEKQRDRRQKRREGKKGNPAEILAETPISKGIPGSEKGKKTAAGTAKATQTIASKARSVASSIVGKSKGILGIVVAAGLFFVMIASFWQAAELLFRAVRLLPLPVRLMGVQMRIFMRWKMLIWNWKRR